MLISNMFILVKVLTTCFLVNLFGFYGKQNQINTNNQNNLVRNLEQNDKRNLKISNFFFKPKAKKKKTKSKEDPRRQVISNLPSSHV